MGRSGGRSGGGALCGVGVEVVILLYYVGLLASLTAQTEFIAARVCRSLVVGVPNATAAGHVHAPRNASDCHHPDVLSEASTWNTYVAVSQTAPALLVVGSLGGLSEAHGRGAVLRLVMVAQLLAAGVVTAVAVFALPLWVLLIASGLQGLSGYQFAMLMAAFSTAADLSTPEQRTVRVARVEGAIFLGLTVGSAGGAALASAFSFEAVFVAATAVYGIGLLVLLLLVPESLPPSKRTPFKGFVRTNTLSSMGIFFRSRTLWVGAIALMLLLCLLFGMASTTVLYLMSKYNFDINDIGIQQTIDSGTKGTTLVFLMPAVVPVLRRRFEGRSAFFHDKLFITVACFFLCVQFAGYAFTPRALRRILFGVPALSLFTGGGATGMRSMLSKQVGADEQGRIFSAIATIEAITSLVSQVGFNSLFAATAGVEDGRVIFYVGIAFSLAVLLLTGGGALDAAIPSVPSAAARALRQPGATRVEPPEHEALLVQDAPLLV